MSDVEMVIKVTELRIDDDNDRDALVRALLRAGYMIKVETRTDPGSTGTPQHWVIIYDD
jgi:hypothetical protein